MAEARGGAAAVSAGDMDSCIEACVPQPQLASRPAGAGSDGGGDGEESALVGDARRVPYRRFEAWYEGHFNSGGAAAGAPVRGGGASGGRSGSTGG
jgi:hypothetical protein